MTHPPASLTCRTPSSISSVFVGQNKNPKFLATACYFRVYFAQVLTLLQIGFVYPERLLFVMVMDCLSKILVFAQHHQLISPLGRLQIPFRASIYADDVIIFRLTIKSWMWSLRFWTSLARQLDSGQISIRIVSLLFLAVILIWRESTVSSIARWRISLALILGCLYLTETWKELIISH